MKPTASIYDFKRNEPGSDDDVCSDLDVWEPLPWDISALDDVADKSKQDIKEKSSTVVRIGTTDNKGIFFKESSGPQWSCCGIIPVEGGYHMTYSFKPDSEDVVPMFGTNAFKVQVHKDNLLYVGGYYNNSSRGGIFLRYISDKWTVPYQHCGLRVISYID